MLSFSHSWGTNLQVKEELPRLKMSVLNFSKHTEQIVWEEYKVLWMHPDDYLPLRIQLRPSNTSIISCFCFLDSARKYESHKPQWNFAQWDGNPLWRKTVSRPERNQSKNHIKAFDFILCFFFTWCFKQWDKKRANKLHVNSKFLYFE